MNKEYGFEHGVMASVIVFGIFIIAILIGMCAQKEIDFQCELQKDLIIEELQTQAKEQK